MSVTALSNFSDRVQDYTIDNLAAVNSVPQTRTISTTAPLAGGGPLSSNLTFSVGTFNDTDPGVVPASGGGTVNFLRADGSWAAGTISGVPANRTLATAPPLAIDNIVGGSGDLSADRTFSVRNFSSLTAGTVPASGGGTTAFLRADGTWANPFGGGGSGPWVHLDASHPGTTDSGNAHISGWLEAESVITNSTAVSTRNASSLGSLQLEAKFPGDGPSLEYYGTTNVPSQLAFRRGRGTLAAPAACQAGDVLGEIVVDGVPTNTTSHTIGHAIQFVVDNVQTNEVRFNTRIKSGDFTEAGSYFHWLTQSGQVFGRNIASVPTPNADNEFLGSFAIKPRSVTSATYQVAEDDSIITLDASSNDIVVTIPWSSASRRGRILIFKRTDSTAGKAVTINSNVGPMDGRSTFSLYANESLCLYGDGVSGWRIFGIERPRFTQATANAAFNNSAVNTAISDGIYFQSMPTGKGHGSRWKIRAGGKYSTTGTPTLRLRYSVDGTTQLLLDSGAITMPSGVTDADWRIEIDTVYTDVGLGVLAPRYAGSYTMISDGSGIVTKYVSRPASYCTDNAGITASLYALWGTASSSNSITCEYAYMDFVPGGLTD